MTIRVPDEHPCPRLIFHVESLYQGLRSASQIDAHTPNGCPTWTSTFKMDGSIWDIRNLRMESARLGLSLTKGQERVFWSAEDSTHDNTRPHTYMKECSKPVQYYYSWHAVVGHITAQHSVA